MISFLKGEIVLKEDDSVILLTDSGIGFMVFVPYPEKVKDRLFISHVKDSREEKLFGFLTFKEKELFEKLIKLPGVGPKSVLTIFKYYSPDELYEIAKGKEKLLVKGVRKKVVKEIMSFLSEDMEERILKKDKFLDAVKILISLGFEREKVYDTLRKIKKSDKELNLDEIVKLSLKEIKNERR